MSAARRRVVVLTTHWGEEASEPVTITRLLAGALARSASVEVIHLCSSTTSPRTRRDSVFVVHELPLRGARPLQAALLRVALSGGRRDRPVPEDFEGELERHAGQVAGVSELLAELAPDAVVLAGHVQPADLSSLGSRGSAPRVLFVPILDGLGLVGEASIGRLVERADQIASVQPAELAALQRAYPERSAEIVALEPALALNRSATEQLLFGVHWFGRYVLLIRSFPPGGARYQVSVTRELLSSLLGVSVAEVDGEKFKISDGENTVELPVNPTRVNLWRLMAHAEMTIDTRPPGPFGQEAVESMLLGTPVVVPTGSAAHAAALAAGGGVGYEELGELVDAARALLAEGARKRLGEAGRAWASARHGDAASFVARAAALAFGGGEHS